MFVALKGKSCTVLNLTTGPALGNHTFSTLPQVEGYLTIDC